MLISLSIKFSRFIYVVACMGHSFLSMSRWHSIACTHLILFIHLSVEWYLGFSPVGLLWRMRLWTLTGVRVCLSPCFQFFGSVPVSGVPGSYCKSLFDFLRNHQTIFLSALLQMSFLSPSFWLFMQLCLFLPCLLLFIIFFALSCSFHF